MLTAELFAFLLLVKAQPLLYIIGICALFLGDVCLPIMIFLFGFCSLLMFQSPGIQIQLPSFVENIRDKLAENIHEMWAMGKIEAGWTFGERREDTMGLHPCLTQFQNLPQAEKRYNVQLAVQTLRYRTIHRTRQRKH